MPDLNEAAKALADRTLEYVAPPPRNRANPMLDADLEMQRLAWAVLAALAPSRTASQPGMSEANAPIPAVQSGAVAWGVRNIDTGHIHSRLHRSEAAAKASARAATSNYGSYETVALYAAPQSEPLPVTREALLEAVRATRLRNPLLGIGTVGGAINADIISDIADAILAALSGKEQG